MDFAPSHNRPFYDYVTTLTNLQLNFLRGVIFDTEMKFVKLGMEIPVDFPASNNSMYYM